MNSKVVLKEASTEGSQTLVKGGFAFHKHLMVFLQRKTKTLHKIIINSQCV